MTLRVVETGRSDTVKLIVEPGNGTRYEAIGVRLSFEGSQNQWLVTFPLEHVGALFAAGAFISLPYVAEKFKHATLPDADLREMVKLIAEITGGTHHTLRAVPAT